MKKGIHPEYKKAKVECACGNSWETMSTKEHISVELCSACHPFYTGKQKLVDTQGRVDKFEAKRRKAEELAAKTPKKKVEKVSDSAEEESIRLSGGTDKEEVKEEVVTNGVPEEKIEQIEEEFEANTVELEEVESSETAEEVEESNSAEAPLDKQEETDSEENK